jgi:hypothetical protein
MAKRIFKKSLTIVARTAIQTHALSTVGTRASSRDHQRRPGPYTVGRRAGAARRVRPGFDLETPTTADASVAICGPYVV